MGLKQGGRSKCGNPNKEEEEEDIMERRDKERGADLKIRSK